MFYIMGGNKVAPPKNKLGGGSGAVGKTYVGKPAASNGAGGGSGYGPPAGAVKKSGGMGGGGGGASAAELKAAED